MDALRGKDIRRFVHVSTDEVYGSIEEGSFDESAPLNPSSPYSASKAGADCVVNAMWETYGLPISVVRPTNVYGPRQLPEKLIPKFILNALNDDTLRLYGDGSNIRQWLFVDDACRAVRKVIEEGGNEIYNMAGKDELSNLEVTKMILQETGKPEELIDFVEDRKGHDFRYSLDDSKIRDELGFEPETGFEEGLSETVEWYRKRADRFSS
ncbi:MAG: GDP-mannose 4,6-dehydratase, partial [Candidatus Nanohaloarchaea archaeon]|nr:GDP-mannose 4,6-dehydratase [Candidatus Nanohaloarchaea archaeon]